MTGFVKRISRKISKLSREQVNQLLAALTEENDIQNSVFDSLSTGLIICDEEYHVILANKSATRLVPFSIRPSDSRSAVMPVWELVSDGDIAEFIQSAFQKQRSNICKEFTLETAGGSIRFITVSLLPLVSKGKVIGSIITVDDITEKRGQETLLRRMESLAGLTNLAANVAHEIKNPLGSISIYIQLLQKSIQKARENDGVLPEQKFLEKYLDVVTEEIARLNGIVVDFLFAVRPVNAELQLLNPNELVSQYLEFCRPELEEKGIAMQLDLMESPPKLLLDSKLFRQVVLNLVQNAEAAMPSGGVLWVGSQVKNDSFILSIADDGDGMDEKTAERIFEPYFTTKTTGTGLGLTMVYKIVKEFSGDIHVQSVPGEGTLFKISLPIPQREHRLLEYDKDKE